LLPNSTLLSAFVAYLAAVPCLSFLFFVAVFTVSTKDDPRSPLERSFWFVRRLIPFFVFEIEALLVAFIFLFLPIVAGLRSPTDKFSSVCSIPPLFFFFFFFFFSFDMPRFQRQDCSEFRDFRRSAASLCNLTPRFRSFCLHEENPHFPSWTDRVVGCDPLLLSRKRPISVPTLFSPIARRKLLLYGPTFSFSTYFFPRVWKGHCSLHLSGCR